MVIMECWFEVYIKEVERGRKEFLVFGKYVGAIAKNEGMGKHGKRLIEGNPNEICWCSEECASCLSILISRKDILDEVNIKYLQLKFNHNSASAFYKFIRESLLEFELFLYKLFNVL